MGEAKRKEAILRAAILRECDRWDRPGSVWEAGVVADLKTLPVFAAQRPSPRQLAQGGMPPRECHANAIWYAANDPDQLTEHVVGWWLQGENYILHSVIRQNGQLFCITPQEQDVPDIFPFIPDDKIEARKDGDVITYYRDGQPIDAGVRSNPEAHRAMMRRMKERIEGGMKPWPAMRLADNEESERLGMPKASG